MSVARLQAFDDNETMQIGCCKTCGDAEESHDRVKTQDWNKTMPIKTLRPQRHDNIACENWKANQVHGYQKLRTFTSRLYGHKYAAECSFHFFHRVPKKDPQGKNTSSVHSTFYMLWRKLGKLKTSPAADLRPSKMQHYKRHGIQTRVPQNWTYEKRRPSSIETRGNMLQLLLACLTILTIKNNSKWKKSVLRL
jgi:hypothetical protein